MVRLIVPAAAAVLLVVLVATAVDADAKPAKAAKALDHGKGRGHDDLHDVSSSVGAPGRPHENGKGRGPPDIKGGDVGEAPGTGPVTRGGGPDDEKNANAPPMGNGHQARARDVVHAQADAPGKRFGHAEPRAAPAAPPMPRVEATIVAAPFVVVPSPPPRPPAPLLAASSPAAPATPVPSASGAPAPAASQSAPLPVPAESREWSPAGRRLRFPRFLLKILAVFGWRRVNARNALASGARRRILDHVRRSPGAHLRGIARALALTPQNVDHHLRHLVTCGLVSSARVGAKRCFYPVEGGRALRDRARARGLLLGGARDRILRAVLDMPGIHQGEVARRVGVQHGSARWSLSLLADAGLVTERRQSRKVCYEATPAGCEALGRLGDVLMDEPPWLVGPAAGATASPRPFDPQSPARMSRR